MITGGIDMGSLSAKAVLLKNNSIIASKVIRTSIDKKAIAIQVFKEVLSIADLEIEDVDYIISTGYGRSGILFADEKITEITCHAVGTNWFFPDVRTLLDMGGEDCKAIRCDNKGRVENFILNEKCAAGTGRFFERIAKTLNVPLEDIGKRSLQPIKGPAKINNTCVVFAQVDAESLLRKGVHVNDILAGCCNSIVERVGSLLTKVGIEEEFSISGGIAKNIGVVKRLEELFHIRAQIVQEPQIIGALGAAVLAIQKGKKLRDRGLLIKRRKNGLL